MAKATDQASGSRKKKIEKKTDDPRCGGRVSKKVLAKSRFERHGGKNLDGEVASNIESLTKTQECSDLGNKYSNHDAPSNVMGIGRGPDAAQCSSIMDLESPPVHLSQCGTTESDIVDNENPFQIDETSSSDNQLNDFLYSAPIEPATNITFDGQPGRENTCKPVFGSSEGTIPLLDYGAYMLPSHGHQKYGSLGCWGENDFKSLYSDYEFDSEIYDCFLLQGQQAQEVPVCVDELHSSMDIESRLPSPPQEAQPDALPPAYFPGLSHLSNQNLENQSSTNNPPTGKYRDGYVMNSGERYLTPPNMEPPKTRSSHLREDWKAENIIDGEKRQLNANTRSCSDQIAPCKRSWACPWYKKDSLKYHECSKYKLLRIKDVKQHTWRKHMKPEYYCPVCFELFTSSEERDGHVRKGGCDSQPQPEFDGISEDQRKSLNQSANRGKSEVEQWYIMWKTIFPDTDYPHSPYLGNDWEKLLPLLRNFWDERRPEIILKARQSSPEPHIVQRIVHDFLDFFEEESLYWGTNSDGSPGTSHNSVPSDPTQCHLDSTTALEEPLSEQQIMSSPDRPFDYIVGSNIDLDLNPEILPQ